MSKINEIENGLIRLEGGKYQKLMDQYLFKKYGFTNIQCLGSQEGTDKTTKGVPDSYVLTSEGKYIVIMYGTHNGKQSGTTAFNKCKADIESCLNRMNKDDIYEMICCHISSNLTIEQDKKLHDLFSNLTLIGLNTLACDLFNRYPNLAKEYLNVNIDTHQILSADEFIKNNNKSVFGTPLDIDLLGRNNEKKELLEQLNNNDLVIVEGPSGVGKTKLAFDVCIEFSKINQFQFYVIKNRSLQIYDDLQSYFSDNGNYILLVDDANQVSDLILILDLIKENSQTKQFKIVLTVRDYAKNPILLKAREILIPIEYRLTSLDTAVIKDIIKSNLNISNSIFLEQISQIAKGNIRLAYMAGQSAIKEGQFKSIQNASEIFDNYFQYAIQGLSQNELILMAIFAFVESFDLDNKDSLIYHLASIKKIEEDEIKTACVKFHKNEIIDIYSDYIAKFSDQNLSDFIIHNVLFEKKLFPLSDLIDIAFPIDYEKVIYHIQTTFSIFYSDAAREYLSKCVKGIWNNGSLTNDLKWQFANAFHPFIDDEVLLFLKDEIGNTETKQIDIIKHHLDQNSPFHQDKVLNILSGYKRSNSKSIALQLLIRYINTNNTEPELIRDTIVRGFGIEKESCFIEYQNEIEVLEELINNYRINPNDNVVFLCVHYALHCLSYSFEFTENGYKSSTITHGSFPIIDCDEITTLHRLAFQCLNSFFCEERYRNYVYNILLKYHPFRFGFVDQKGSLSDIVLKDCALFKETFESSIDFGNVVDCNLVKHIHDSLKTKEFDLPEYFFKWKENKHFSIIEDLQEFFCFTDSKQRESAEEERKNHLLNVFETLSVEDIKQILIDSTRIKLNNEWQFYDRLSTIVVELNEKKFLEVAKLMIEFTPKNNYVRLIIAKMIELIGFKKTQAIIFSFNLSERISWCNTLINMADPKAIDDEFCRMIINGIREKYYLYRLDFDTLMCIKSIIPEFLAEYINTVLDISDLKSNHTISMLIHRGIVYCNNDMDVFIDSFDNIDQLKSLYKLATKERESFDYDGSILVSILLRDESFFVDLLDLYAKLGYHYRDGFHSFKKIWELDNYESLLDSAIDYLQKTKDYYKREQCIKAFFNSNKTVGAKQVEYLKRLISKYLKDKRFLHCLLRMCNGWTKEQRFEVTLFVISLDKSIETFKESPIAPYPKVMSGSEVPYIDKRIDEYRELIEQLENVDYLEHRVFCNKIIVSLQQQKEQVLKREFIYNF